MSKDIKVGDIVRVADWGEVYDLDAAWVETQYTQGKIPLNFVAQYAYGDNYNYWNHKYDDDTRYEVLYVGDGPKPKVLICEARPIRTKIYLLNIAGIELYPVEIPISTIEEKLGIKNLKIIGDR